MRRPSPIPLSLSSMALCLLVQGALVAPLDAQTRVLGFQDCQKCHKPAVDQWSKTEPAQLGGKAHFNTHRQLAVGDAARFAAAVGVSDPSDPNSSCAECHATVVRRRVRGGISCESCHGAAERYLEVHDKEPWRESYARSLPLGLADLHGKTAAIAGLCVDCHVTPDQRLAAAGHPNGANFDAGASLRKIVHWTAPFTPNQQEHASYDFAAVTAAAKPLIARRLAGGGGSARSSAPAATAARAPAPVAVAAAAPWDWDQPVAALPADYPSEESRPATPPPAPPPPPSIAEDLPLSFDAAPSVEPAFAEPEPTGPPPAAAQLAQLRGEAAALIAELLAEGRSSAAVAAPAAPGEFSGPDGELLHLQDVVLYLALETLRGEP